MEVSLVLITTVCQVFDWKLPEKSPGDLPGMNETDTVFFLQLTEHCQCRPTKIQFLHFDPGHLKHSVSKIPPFSSLQKMNGMFFPLVMVVDFPTMTRQGHP